jgi:hypothetical protein
VQSDEGSHEVLLMIHPEKVYQPTTRPRSFTVIQGGQEFDLAKFASTLTMLESYVDSVLAANELAAVGPGLEDEAMDVRLASF